MKLVSQVVASSQGRAVCHSGTQDAEMSSPQYPVLVTTPTLFDGSAPARPAMWRPLLLHLLDLATVVATTSQCLERWGELRRYLLQSSLRERSVGDVSDDPLSSSTFFEPLLRTGARELKRMKWQRIRRGGVTDEVVSFVLESFPLEKQAITESPEGVRLLSHF